MRFCDCRVGVGTLVGCTSLCRVSPESEQNRQLFRQFEHWMQTHHGVQSSTLRNYRKHIVELLSTLGEHPEQFTADALHTFILNYALGRSHALAKKRVTAVRILFGF